MSGVIPETLLERYGKRELTSLNGIFWWIPPEATEQICAELTALGWNVEHAPELPFW